MRSLCPGIEKWKSCCGARKEKAKAGNGVELPLELLKRIERIEYD